MQNTKEEMNSLKAENYKLKIRISNLEVRKRKKSILIKFKNKKKERYYKVRENHRRFTNKLQG